MLFMSRTRLIGDGLVELPKACHEHATHLSYMIDWKRKQVLKPPYLKKFSNKEIRKFESTPLVDRCICLITENGTRAASSTLRDGLCHSTIESRQRQGKQRLISQLKDYRIILKFKSLMILS